MAGELIGGALLSAFLQVAFDRLASRDLLDYFRGRKLDETLLKNLKVMLSTINEVIDDAETKEITSSNVKAWVDDVKDAVFDAEDLLDEIDYEVSKGKHDEAENQTSSSKVWSFFTASLNSFDKEIESRMKQVLDNLKNLASQMDMLGLKKASGVGAGLGRKGSDRLPSTSLVDEADIYGRDDDREIVIKWLLSQNENDRPPVSIISVVGMGGLGKTTLAQLVYNDQRIKDEFDLKAWICVSEEFDVTRVTKTILENYALSTGDTNDLNMLQLQLKEKLTGKKFLLVLDDIWNENLQLWEALKAPFTSGAQGSKILVTTRSNIVASIVRSAKVHQLKELPEESSWLLFAKHAFRDGDPRSHPDQEEVGRNIIKKCKGLPLALKTIGSLLYTKLSVEEWNNILRSEIWDMSTNERNILPALRLSYHYLPSHLKRCFAYCSLFPKDYEFDKLDLVQLWMAENFLHQHPQSKSISELGDQHFNDLLSRSFFQRSSGDRNFFVMHDLINDLAKYVSAEFSFRLEVENAQPVSKMIRHFSYLKNWYETSKRFKTIYRANRLRTFLPLCVNHNRRKRMCCIPGKVIDNLLSKCKCLRVLSLWGYYNIIELPDSLGNLKHLRYLDLSYTKLKKLPDSICLLYNLQTLKLRGCRWLEELPLELHRLINLCHLDFHGTKVRKIPNELGKLKNLQVLTSFYVGKCNKTDIKQLGELSLGGKLSILELQNVVHPMDALAANLKSKINLEELSFEWSGNNEESQREREVLENLQPHKNIKRLSVTYYGGTRFPGWFADYSLRNLVSLELKNCKYCLSLPPLGLLRSLKTLKVDGFDGIEVIGSEFYGHSSCSIPFESLEILKFGHMLNWVEWECKIVSGAFPRLQELYFEDCPKLKKHLPDKLGSLRKLAICNCQELVASLTQESDLKILKVGGCFLEESLRKEIEDAISNKSLEELEICRWPNMELPLYHSYNFLLRLHITSSCKTLRSFPLDLFPSLQELSLKKCKNLEMISVSEVHDHNLTSLTTLIISSCPKFVSFPMRGFLKLERCDFVRLDSLQALHNIFPSIVNLKMEACPQLKSFCEGGLPSNLKYLRISNCPKLTASGMKWGLHAPTSLYYFYLKDQDVESFPDEGLLPPSLTRILIDHCSNLRRLDYKGLCRLSSLKELYIFDCPRIQCLPEEGLPSSLHTLFIEGDCPLLKQRCQKRKGDDWGKVAHIPYFKIDEDIITWGFDPLNCLGKLTK